MLRNALVYVVELAGAVGVTVGAAQASHPLGWVTGGGFCLLFARGLSR